MLMVVLTNTENVTNGPWYRSQEIDLIKSDSFNSWICRRDITTRLNSCVPGARRTTVRGAPSIISQHVAVADAFLAESSVERVKSASWSKILGDGQFDDSITLILLPVVVVGLVLLWKRQLGPMVLAQPERILHMPEPADANQ